MLRIIEHSFLVMLICNNLSKFCRIVHFDQYYVANISFVFFFTGVQGPKGKSIIILLLRHSTFGVVLFTSFTARFLWNWNVLS